MRNDNWLILWVVDWILNSLWNSKNQIILFKFQLIHPSTLRQDYKSDNSYYSQFSNIVCNIIYLGGDISFGDTSLRGGIASLMWKKLS